MSTFPAGKKPDSVSSKKIKILIHFGLWVKLSCLKLGLQNKKGEESTVKTRNSGFFNITAEVNLRYCG